jgi:putative SOS response-associated peptidase YedK
LSCSSIRVSTSGSGKDYSFRLVLFISPGYGGPPTREWPAAYTIITIESNRDIAPYHDHEMTVLCRDERTAWLDMSRPEYDLLHTAARQLPCVSRLPRGRTQPALAI